MEPLKFNALLKSTIWGGEKIIPFKHLDVQQENVGESWEISGVPGNETVVANGEFSVKNKIFHTQDLCLRTNLRCAKNSARMEVTSFSSTCW